MGGTGRGGNCEHAAVVLMKAVGKLTKVFGIGRVTWEGTGGVDTGNTPAGREFMQVAGVGGNTLGKGGNCEYAAGMVGKVTGT